MRESTRLFMEKRCAENRVRMAREAKGDYGPPIHIVSSPKQATHIIVNGVLVKKEKEMTEHTEEEKKERCRVCICEEQYIEGFCENECQSRRK